jgi:hypothetical protein
MGAEHVEFVASAPIEGMARFVTTNGTGFYDRITDKVFLNDACLIIEIDPHSLSCRHVTRPKNLYIGAFTRHEDKLRFEFYADGMSPRSECVDYADIHWTEGLGLAQGGRFPSAA